MTNRIIYTEEEKSAARHTDIASFLSGRGEQLKRNGNEWVWSKGGERITIRGNLWYNHYRMEGGNAIDFVRSFCEVDFPTAMRMLTGNDSGSEIRRCDPLPYLNKRAFVLPDAYHDVLRVVTYLEKDRCIDPAVIAFFLGKRTIYEDDHYHNVVFVGHDETGKPRHAHKRGSYPESSFKANATGSQAEYSFHHIGTSNRIYVFEAPIDMLSFISLNPDNWQRDSYIALCSVSPKALLHQLKVNPKIRNVCLCLDNDTAGNSACKRITEQLRLLGDFSVDRIAPTLKDWNEDLCSYEECLAHKI